MDQFAVSYFFKHKCSTRRTPSLIIDPRQLATEQCRSKGNISGGTRAPEARAARGVWGTFPQKILKSRGLEMLFPAFSKSYL